MKIFAYDWNKCRIEGVNFNYFKLFCIIETCLHTTDLKLRHVHLSLLKWPTLKSGGRIFRTVAAIFKAFNLTKLRRWRCWNRPVHLPAKSQRLNLVSLWTWEGVLLRRCLYGHSYVLYIYDLVNSLVKIFVVSTFSVLRSVSVSNTVKVN